MAQLVLAINAAPDHRFPNNPECPERVEAIRAALWSLRALENAAVKRQAAMLGEAPPLPEGLLASVHTSEHVNCLRKNSATVSGPTAIKDPDDPDGPTFATPSSYEDALTAACTAVALVDAVVAGSAGSSSSSSGNSSGQAPATCGLSICRPPGHHATPGDQMGFCLLNNAALAARHVQRRHGLAKVLILDWDVHHGNGTQDCFWQDPSVLLIDLHQAGVWPGSGAAEETGAGAGEGATINVPLPYYSGHAAAHAAFEAVVAPAARRFQPDFIIVSAGYDAHWQDPLEHLQFQSGTFHWLTARMQQLAAELCGGRLLMLLEGGYNQQALAESVAESVLALLGEPSGRPLLETAQLPHPEPTEEVAATLERVRCLHGL